MKKRVFSFIFLFFILILNFGCRPALGGAWYNTSHHIYENSSNNNSNNNEEEEEIPEDDNQGEAFIEVEPFSYFGENYLYPANNFDDWVLYMTGITSTNLASYKFDTVTPWHDNGNGEFFYQGQPGAGNEIGNGQQNYTIDLKYYKYKNRKDRWFDTNGFAPSLDAEEAEKQKRFYFYRFKGTTVGNSGSIDNATFCVDTYSKFLFFYSEPAQKKVVFGNTIPSDWRDYESPTVGLHSHCEKKFYEYDPVGFVREDGSVVIYNWFKAKIVASDYSPSMNEKFKFVAKAGEKGRPGHSPYKYEKLKIYNSEDDSGNTMPVLWMRAKSLKNSSIAGLKWTTYLLKWVSAPTDPLFSYSLKGSLSYTENENQVKNTIEFVERNNGEISGSADDFQAIKTGSELFFDYSKFFQQEIPAESKDQAVSLDMQIVKSNRKGTAGLENSLSEPFYLYKFENPIVLTYDKDSKTWKCAGVTEKEVIPEGTNQPCIKISYPAFELKRGQMKDFTITILSAPKDSDSGWTMSSEGEIEVTYTIGFN
ncbi:hypothetical protein E4O03_09900 [Treponema sp. OMZ 792]|uniref:hypothetical protein n=1 Tax=unclassified Treponema TaxID=2638727 RepID=UPI0020A54B9C|nr:MULTISPECIES: hypothetical protein [unclassified Treponema]UTC74521.1 hypothetical protein E4O03_09900 [Treponema sp. OMZ 792]UTC80917.1 hypothetical protein E4O07_09805 [Treponema sp. OMZ 798]